MLNKAADQQGFSLLEIAITLVLITILMQTSLSVLNQARHIQTYQTTAEQLQDIKQTLLSFIQINYYLPCPDTDNDGLENRQIDGRCHANRGTLPYLEFGGLGKQDEFGNPFLYAINSNSTSNTNANNLKLACRSASVFAHSGSITNKLYQCLETKNLHCSNTQCNSHCAISCQTVNITRSQTPYFHQITAPLGTSTSLLGGLRVCKKEASACDTNTTEGQTIGNILPIVVVSFGRNGAVTWQDCSSAGAHEHENCDDDAYFRQERLSEEFDDQLIWLTMHEIKALMPGKLYWHL